jgi:hypothetical protein
LLFSSDHVFASNGEQDKSAGVCSISVYVEYAHEYEKLPSIAGLTAAL